MPIATVATDPDGPHADRATRARQALQQRRAVVERMLEQARHFDEADRLLLEQVYRHGLTMTEVSRLTGERARTVQRRVHRLLDRLNQPLFRFVAARFNVLPRDLQATARRAVLQGRSLRETARLTGLSLHRVRQHLTTLHTLARHI